MTEWKEYRDQLLASDAELRRGYERLGPLYDIITDVLRLRYDAGLTQAELAKRMGKQQPAIARFEAGNVMPTLTYLQDLAEALGAKLIVRLEPIADEAPSPAADQPSEPVRKTPRPSRRRAVAAKV